MTKAHKARVRLTTTQEVTLAALYVEQAELPVVELARRFNVSPATVSAVVRRQGVKLRHRPIDETEYRRLFAALAQEGAEAILVTDASENTTNLRLVIELAEKGRLPAMYPYRHFVEAGGLMSYGVDLRELGRRAADMADRILKGTKPREIPVLLPTKFELTINLKTAKALGLTVPPELLATADEVIE